MMMLQMGNLRKNKELKGSFRALFFVSLYNLEKNKFKKKGKYREYKKTKIRKEGATTEAQKNKIQKEGI